jgi:outer membrane receptor protein involved in Fe transport
MKHKQKAVRVVSGLNACSVLILGSAAAATPAVAQSVGGAADHDTAAIQEVVVTARKREEKLLDVPAPVSAIDAQTLALTKATRLEDYLIQTPGVTFDQQRAGQTKVTFRGVNAGDVGATVVTYLDNIPLTPGGAHASSAFLTPDLDPSDIAQIEVDRGPQGTLYGANAIGGVLKYVSIKPDPNNLTGRVEVAGESLSHGGTGAIARGAVNLPLVADKLAVRVSAFSRNDPGYIDDPLLKRQDVNGSHVSGGRVALLWNAAESLTVNLSGMMQVTQNHGTDFVDYDPLTGQTLYGDLTRKRYLQNEWFNARYAVYNADIQWDLHWAKLLSSSSYSTLSNGGDSDLTPGYGPLFTAILGRPNTGADNPLVVHGKQLTEELRLTSSGEDRVEWQVGAYYTHDRTQYDQGIGLFDTGTQEFLSAYGVAFGGYHKNLYIERSLFGNFDVHFTPQFDVAFGGRYSEDDQTLNSFFEGFLFGAAQHVDNSEREHAITWAVNPRYKLTENQMVYARVATGYRAGGVSFLRPAAVAAGLPSAFKPDHLTSYEAGWKGSFLDRRVTLDLSAYYIRWTDVQEAVTLGSFSFLSNGGLAHSKGVEATVTWAPVTGLSLNANLTYNDNRLDRDQASSPELSQAGNHLPGTPKLSGSFAADYKWDLTEQLQAFVGGSVFATTARPNALQLGFNPNTASGVGPMPNFGQAPIYDPNTNAIIGYTSTKLPGYATVDLRAGLQHGPWTVQAYVKNLTDSRARSEANGLNDPNFANYSSQWTAVILRPRTVGLSLVWAF